MSFKSEDYCSVWQMLDVRRKKNSHCAMPPTTVYGHRMCCPCSGVRATVPHGWFSLLSSKRIQFNSVATQTIHFPHQLHLNTSHNPSYNRFHVYFLCSYFTKLPWGSRQYLAACGRVGEESPRLTNGRQDADVINAKKEEKSTRETQKQVQWYKWKKSAEA